MSLAAAVRPARDGAFLDVSVATGRSEAAFPAGFDPWRERIKVRVTAAPRDGEANRELLDLAKAFFDAPVAIASGDKDPQKRLWVGRPPDEVVARLEWAGVGDEEDETGPRAGGDAGPGGQASSTQR